MANERVTIANEGGSKKVSVTSAGAKTPLDIALINDTGTQVNPLSISNNLEGKGKVAVGTTAVEITFTGTPQSIIISADTSNSGTLYIGKSDVTSLGANAIAFLEAGESVEIDYDDTSNALYVVASEASQNYWAGALI